MEPHGCSAHTNKFITCVSPVHPCKDGWVGSWLLPPFSVSGDIRNYLSLPWLRFIQHVNHISTQHETLLKESHKRSANFKGQSFDGNSFAT